MLIHSTVILLKKLKCVSSQWLIVELGFPNSTVRTYQSSVLAKCIWFLCDLSEQCYSFEEESFSTIFFGGLCKIYFVITLSGLSHYIQLTINVCTYACSHCLRALLLDIPLGNEKIIDDETPQKNGRKNCYYNYSNCCTHAQYMQSGSL